MSPPPLPNTRAALITILDFEKIVAEINPHVSIRQEDIESLSGSTKITAPVLVVEDSTLLSRMVVTALNRAGYVNVTKVKNGQEAWDFLGELQKSPVPVEQTLRPAL